MYAHTDTPNVMNNNAAFTNIFWQTEWGLQILTSHAGHQQWPQSKKRSAFQRKHPTSQKSFWVNCILEKFSICRAFCKLVRSVLILQTLKSDSIWMPRRRLSRWAMIILSPYREESRRVHRNILILCSFTEVTVVAIIYWGPVLDSLYY